MIKRRKTKDGKNRYQASVKIQGSRVYRTCETLDDAQRWKNSIRFKRDRNLSVSDEPVSVDMMFANYEAFAEAKGKAPNTLRAARQRFHAYIKPFFGGHDMRTVEVEEIEAFLALCRGGQMSETGKALSPATCNRIRSLLSVMFSTAIKKRSFGRAFTQNPFTSIEKLSEGRRLVKYWTFEEAERFLEANRDSFYYPFFLTVLQTGMRVGEAVAVTDEQVDQKIDMLAVDRQYNEALKKILPTTKGNDFRHIALTPEVVELLYPLLGRGRVFTRTDGAPLLPNYVRKFVMPQACAKAEVKDIGPHGLRHTFAAHYLMKGGTLWDLSKILGHSSTKVTEGYYAHFDLEHVRNRMAVVTRRGNLIQANFAAGGGTRGGT